jgi:hypothetical protein
LDKLKGRDNGEPRHTGYWKDNTGCKGVDLSHVAQVRVQWRALVNIVMNIQVLKRQEMT